ncbi:Zn-ribbon domain-containing OB-fold protein [Streptomyces orinoci]|uniref:Zn-ribbon domain-containing OB-fold protein n=1 Tax=Streptomyces orinoci TaxID=67339 RepID=A0ABV3JY46_STRON|nr:Zn-ribbon domain-containing OB-fold protein [Streptomyces orinoci]
MGLSPSTGRFDVPEIDEFTRPYWEAAAGGRLLIRRCRAAGCGRAHHYPREFCPHCWSEDVIWEEASGHAVLYTWSVVHMNDLPPFRGRLPYVAAMADLAEGPRLATELVDCEPDALRMGMPLEVVFRALPDASGGPDGRPAPLAPVPGSDGPGDAAGMPIVPCFRPR